MQPLVLIQPDSPGASPCAYFRSQAVVFLIDIDFPSIFANAQLLFFTELLDSAVVLLVSNCRSWCEKIAASYHRRDEGKAEEEEWMPIQGSSIKSRYCVASGGGRERLRTKYRRLIDTLPVFLWRGVRIG